MQATSTPASDESSRLVWAGRFLSGLVALFLVLDGAIKLVPIQPVIDTAVQLGWPTDPGTWRLLGSVLLAATALYVYPRTSVLGAIVLTAYLGGAIATHVRINSPLFTHTFFGIYVGVILWAGLWLHNLVYARFSADRDCTHAASTSGS